MWKWLAVAALIYGLIAAAALVAPHSMLVVRAMDLQALGQAWHDLKPPPNYDFEGTPPPALTRPASAADVVAVEDGNHIMRWEPPAAARFAFLGLPVHVPDPPPEALAVRLRTEGLPQVMVGLREEDGSAYIAQVQAGPEWERHVIPLADLHPAPRTEDENGRLDPDQVTALFVACGGPERELPRQTRRERIRERRSGQAQPPAVVELDDFGFAPLPPPDALDRQMPEPPPDAEQPGPPERGEPPAGGRRGPPPPGGREPPPR